MNKTLLFILVFMMTPLTAGCGTFTSPEIKGKVVDADTGKPLAGANVKAVWKIGRATVGGLADVKNARVYKTQTNENGEFVLPAVRGKKYLVFGTYEGVYILTYKIGYKAEALYSLSGRSYNYEKDKRVPSFFLRPLKTEKDYYDGYYNVYWGIFDYDHPFEIEFLKDYIAKYPQSSEIRYLLVRLAYHYEEPEVQREI